MSEEPKVASISGKASLNFHQPLVTATRDLEVLEIPLWERFRQSFQWLKRRLVKGA
jgi:hypothetical protein